MAFTTENTATGDGSTTDFSFTFPYINESDVKVTITDANGVPQSNTAFTFANATTLSFTSAPASGRTVRIFRDTNLDNAEVTFFAGSAIRAEDLNDNQNQVLFSAQEVENNAILLTGGTMTGPLVLDDTTLKIQEGSDTLTIAAPTLTADRTVNFTDVGGDIVTTGDTGTVATGMIANDAINADKIADDVINSEHYVDGSIDTAHIADAQITTAKLLDANVTTAKIADSNVTTAKIADSNVTTAKIADANVTTAKIADANVTTAKIANDAVTADKIPDDALNSEHYAAGSIDTEHIADSQVTTAKIADSNVTTAKIANANVTTVKIADSNVTTAKIADSNVTTAKIADSNVTTAKIAADAITSAKLADGVIDSEHLVDASIDTQHIADLQITTAKIAADAVTNAKIADDSIDSEHYVDGSIDTAHIADSQVTTAKLADDAVTGAKIADTTITSAHLTAGTVVINSEQSGASVNDTSFFTTSASDARYFRQDSTETIDSGDTWTGSDAFIATTGAIDARIIDLVDDVGGFVPIADETSFPTANPDVNDGAGTIVSVASIATTRTPSSGTVTIANGSGSNTVTITGCGSSDLESGYGMLVETTTTLHTYAFHRLVPRATEVTTVAGISADITTAATNVADINNFADVYQISGSEPSTRADSSALQDGDLCYRTDLDVIQVFDGTNYSNITPDQATINDITIVADDLASFEDLGSVADDLVANQSGGALETCADNIADIRTLADIEDGTEATDAIQTVANISADVTAVAGRATEIGRLGTADAVADMAILGTTDVVADMAILGTTDVVADMNTLATTDVVADLETCADNNANITTVADDITDVNSVAGSISNVNTVAGSIADVNRYANEYTISASAPGSPSEGDLWYDSTNNELKFFDGTTFNAISAGISQLADDTSPEISTSASQLDMNSKNITEVGTIDGTNMALDFGTL